MQFDYPTGTAIVTAAIVVFAWLPILVAASYAAIHRANIPNKSRFVAHASLLAWGASSAPTFLLMPIVVWVNSASPALSQQSSLLATAVGLVAGPASFLTNYQFFISVGLLVATSFWAPGFLYRKSVTFGARD